MPFGCARNECSLADLALSGGGYLMSDDDPAARFREQAEYCRQQAQKAHDPRDKEAWLKVASDWLQMSADAERRRGQREADN